MGSQSAVEERIRIVEGDITLLDVGAVVNAANTHLRLGGGVAGAIRTRGGPAIQVECDRMAPIEVGEAVITGGGNLKAKYVIHAVGPVNGEGDEEAKLARATLSSLRIASDRKILSLACPAISTGIYGFPLQECSQIMLRVVLEFLKKNGHPREVVFCLYSAEAYEIFRKTLDSLRTWIRSGTSSPPQQIKNSEQQKRKKDHGRRGREVKVEGGN